MPGKLYEVTTLSDTPCPRCLKHIGITSYDRDTLPEPPFHHGCKCFVRVYDVVAESQKLLKEELEKNGHLLDSEGKKIELDAAVVKEMNTQIQRMFSYLNKDGTYNEAAMEREWNDTIDKYNKEKDTILTRFNGWGVKRQFFEEYLNMVAEGVIGSDNVRHSMANARSSRDGMAFEDFARIYSASREAEDFSKALEKGVDKRTILREALRDIYNNVYGRILGRDNKRKGREWLSEKIIEDKVRKNLMGKKSAAVIRKYERENTLPRDSYINGGIEFGKRKLYNFLK